MPSEYELRYGDDDDLKPCRTIETARRALQVFWSEINVQHMTHNPEYRRARFTALWERIGGITEDFKNELVALGVFKEPGQAEKLTVSQNSIGADPAYNCLMQLTAYAIHDPDFLTKGHQKRLGRVLDRNWETVMSVLNGSRAHLSDFIGEGGVPIASDTTNLSQEGGTIGVALGGLGVDPA